MAPRETEGLGQEMTRQRDKDESVGRGLNTQARTQAQGVSKKLLHLDKVVADTK